jgi:glycosyltransferase involved in cell wall biosynthesis
MRQTISQCRWFASVPGMPGAQPSSAATPRGANLGCQLLNQQDRPATVSVIMAVRNGGDYLAEALDSVLAQTFTRWELWVVNDGSTDDTRVRLDDYARRDSRIHVVHRANGGQASARMLALSRCTGEFIGNLDADYVMLPERLERQVCFLHEHPEVGMVGSAAELIDDRGRPYCTYIWPTSDPELRLLLQRDNAFFHSAVMVRAPLLKKAGGYDAVFTVAEDYDLWLRIARHTHIANLAVPLIRYRTHVESLTRTRRRVAAREVLGIQWRAIRRGWHRPWATVFLLRPLFYLLAPQLVAEAIYWYRERRNRGVVVRTASPWPRLGRPNKQLAGESLAVPTL